MHIQGEPIEVGDRSVEQVFSYVLDIAGGISFSFVFLGHN